VTAGTNMYSSYLRNCVVGRWTCARCADGLMAMLRRWLALLRSCWDVSGSRRELWPESSDWWWWRLGDAAGSLWEAASCQRTFVELLWCVKRQKRRWRLNERCGTHLYIRLSRAVVVRPLS